jgi:uncharacterized protein YqeY
MHGTPNPMQSSEDELAVSGDAFIEDLQTQATKDMGHFMANLKALCVAPCSLHMHCC